MRTRDVADVEHTLGYWVEKFDSQPVEPDDVHLELPPVAPLSADRIRRYDVLDALEELGSYNPDEMTKAEMILRGIPAEQLLAVTTEKLTAAVVAMLPDADIDGEYDEDGIGHAWVTSGMRFEDALASVRPPSMTMVVTSMRPRSVSNGKRTPRTRRARAARSSRGRPGRRSSGSDDPGEHDDLDVARRGGRVSLLGGRS